VSDVFSDLTQTEPDTSKLPLLPRTSLQISVVRLAREYGLPLILLAISVVTTTAIGARFMQNFLDGNPTIVSDNDLWPWPWLFAQPDRFLSGWTFSANLLTILLSHEFGHYFACRAHRIRATLPCVLPAPTLSGTLGAVIQIKGRIPNRVALIDVGIYGPLAGYISSLAAIVAGLLLSRPATPGHPAALIGFGEPLTIHIVDAAINLVYPGSPSFGTAVRHPILIAGWIGLLITSLNLIPGGQLDGGHILYAISPRAHRTLRWFIPAALFLCGFFFWVGWILWGSMLLIPAMHHPRLTIEEPLPFNRKLLGWLALVLLLLTFSPSPFAASSIYHYLHW